MIKLLSVISECNLEIVTYKQNCTAKVNQAKQ